MNPSTSFDPNIINQLIRTRRSVFVDQLEPGKQIPDEIIMQALQNANYAPTHKLTSPWRFFVYSGPGLKTLAEKQAAIYKEFAGAKFKQDKYEKLLVTPLQCSHVIGIGMKRHASKVPEIEEIIAVGCAIQNIYLTITAYGFGGYISTGGIVYMEQAKEFLGLGPEDKLIGFFYLGYPRIASPPRTPEPVEEKITWVKE